MLQRFNPVKYRIQSSDVIFRHKDWHDIQWASTLYSGMIATHMKKEHELENDFVYDCVVRMRYDVIFPPTSTFKVYMSRMADRTLYHTTQHRMFSEYNQLNSNDVLFYGDSWGMDIAGDTFRDACRHRSRLDDTPRSGPGTIITNSCLARNVEHRVDYHNDHEVILRKEVCDKDIVADFEEIYKFHKSFYE